MKKRIIPIVLILSMMFCVCVVAAPRYDDSAYITPTLSFSGTTANCGMRVDANSGTSIKATLALTTSDGSSVKTWYVNGTTTLTYSGTCGGLTRGTSYTLTATAVVDGQTISNSTSATCK